MKNRENWAFLLGTVFMLVGVAVAAGPATGGPKAIFDNPVEPEMTPQLNLGKMNYDAHCASCHGKSAGGSDKGPTFISRIYHPGHHADGSFYLATKRGARAHHFKFGEMKPVEGVSDAQIKSILEYVRAVQKANGVF